MTISLVQTVRVKLVIVNQLIATMANARRSSEVLCVIVKMVTLVYTVRLILMNVRAHPVATMATVVITPMHLIAHAMPGILVRNCIITEQN